MRPLAVGELLDAAIKVCTAHAGTLLRAVLVVVVPVQLVSAVVLLSTVSDADTLNQLSTELPEEDADGAFLGGQVVVGLLSVVSVLVATGACFRAVAEGWLGRRPDWRESLRFGARRAPALLWVSVLFGLGVFAGLIALVVPGIFLGVAWAVAFPVLFVEDARGTEALGRSLRLVRGRWWPTFGVLAVGFVLAGVVGLIFTFAFSALIFVNDSVLFAVLVTTVGGVISTALTTPFQAALVSLVYFDLRVRKEGLDLELLADRLGGGAPVTAGAAPAPAWPGPSGGAPAPPWPAGGSAPAPAPPAGWLPPSPDDRDDPGAPPGWSPPRPGAA